MVKHVLDNYNLFNDSEHVHGVIPGRAAQLFNLLALSKRASKARLIRDSILSIIPKHQADIDVLIGVIATRILQAWSRQKNPVMFNTLKATIINELKKKKLAKREIDLIIREVSKQYDSYTIRKAD